MIILLGALCVHINHLFYLRHGPFWDSVSYDDLLARVMLSVRAGGMLRGLSLMSGSTVALPWIQAALIAPFFEPSRAIAVWIQIFWMIVAALVGYVYFRRIAGYTAVTAACCALIFFFIASTFAFDGGVPDFKLDYLQYTLFGLACFLYLTASADNRLWIWALWGIAVGLVCLARATAPVYAAIVFGPFLLIDLWRERRGLRSVTVRYAVGFLACIYTCGWFYLNNLAHLYVYYFIWNPDAHANLPLSVTKQHAINVFNHVGSVAACACLAIFALNIVYWKLNGVPGRWNLRALWCGIAPLAFLIAIGSGPATNLSEIAAFGFVLFALAPFTSSTPQQPKRGRTLATAVAFVVIAAAGVYEGFPSDTDETGRDIVWAPPRSAVAEIIRCITDDLAPNATGTRTFAVLYSGNVNSDVIMNSLIFDERFPAEVSPEGDLEVRFGQTILTMSSGRFDRLVMPVQWSYLEGADDDQKIDALARDLVRQTDYLIVPSKGSVLPAATINSYSDRIGDRAAELVPLQPLCRNVEIRAKEIVNIYRNDARGHSAQTGAG